MKKKGKVKETMSTQEMREQLVDYLMVKNCLISENSGGMFLTNGADISELLDWDIADIRKAHLKVTNALAQYKADPEEVIDSDLCPWCAITHCDVCNYGHRHTDCNRQGRHYGNLIKAMGKKIKTLMGYNIERFERFIPESTKTIKGALSIMKELSAAGYKVNAEGVWKCKPSKNSFVPKMWQHCGTDPEENSSNWEPEWLEEV